MRIERRARVHCVRATCHECAVGKSDGRALIFGTWTDTLPYTTMTHAGGATGHAELK